MTVRELIGMLEKLEPSGDVFLSADAEGNGFWAADCADHGIIENEDGSDGGVTKSVIIWPRHERVDYDEIP